MTQQNDYKVMSLLQDQVLKRKAMFIPLFAVSAFGLVGYAAADRTAPVIASDKIQVLYGTDLTASDFEITDNRDSADDMNVSIDTASYDNSQLGTYTVTVNATDRFNNSTEKDVEVEVIDTTAPVIAAKDADGYSIDVEVGSSSDLTDYITATDNVDGDVSSFMSADAKLDTSRKGVQTITVEVSDNSGNTAEKTFQFNVQDTIAPTIKAKKSTVTLNYGESFDASDYVTTSDNSDEDVDVTVDGNVNTTKIGTYKVNVIATDAAGNSSKKTLKVKVKDVEAPTLKLTKSQVTILQGSSFSATSYIKSATDNKDGDVTSDVKVSGKVKTGTTGTYYLTYSVSDDAGNKTSETLRVNVVTTKSGVTVKKVVTTTSGGKKKVTYKKVKTSSSSSSSSSSSTTSSSGNSSIVSVALSKVGCAYVYGATGSNAFDCSGLAQYVYAKCGKSLPRTAAAQYAATSRVSYSNLKAGDLVFFKGTSSKGGITHVAIYIGNGKIVHAATPSRGVIVSSLSSSYYQSHYAGAGRA